MACSKGTVMYAKTDFDCLECGTTLKAGERTPHQTLCTVGRNTTVLSPCQAAWYNKKKVIRRKELQFIICDICKQKTKQLDLRQVRCVTGIKGVLSECQIIAKDRVVASFRKKKKEQEERDKKNCLKCGNPFPSTGDYHRICDSCSAVNNRMVRNTHKVMVSA
jgi:hypothetical protein